ncbi:hypothetical protein HYX02_02485 [Candidatus Woesearchaeota archaeon]|nr:hypothetical protein [Candidatus Woesearchaeota archaeon]
MYIFSNVIGVFVFDDKFDVVDETLFKEIGGYKSRENLIEKIRDKHKNLKELDEKALKSILLHFKNRKYFNNFYSQNIQLTKIDVKNSVTNDILIIHSIKLVDELDKAINLLIKKLREWYELHNPEFSVAVQNHEKFVEEILEKEKSELLNQLKINPNDSMGADLGQEDTEPIKSLAHQIYDLYQLKKEQLNYISTLMDEICQNIKAVCGVAVAAKLIERAGSLKRLSEMPASTIQILGAETALFRHLKTGAKPPRHGVIVHHPLIAQAPNKMHGKIARTLADKISIAVKVDYFQGKFIGDKLRKELEKKFEK